MRSWGILSFFFLYLLYLNFDGIPNFERCQISARVGEGIKKASREGRLNLFFCACFPCRKSNPYTCNQHQQRIYP